MIGLLATLRVKPEKAEEFQTLFAEIATLVGSTEPETELYKLMRNPKVPGEFRVVEFYTSKAGLDFHMKNAATQHLMKSMGALFDAPPEMVMLEGVE